MHNCNTYHINRANEKKKSQEIGSIDIDSDTLSSVPDDLWD